MYNSLNKFSSIKEKFKELEVDVKYIRDHSDFERTLTGEDGEDYIISFVNPLEISYMIHRNQLTYKDGKLFVNGISDLQYAQLHKPLELIVEGTNHVLNLDSTENSKDDFMLSWHTSLPDAIVSNQTDYITYNGLKCNSKLRWEINNFWRYFGERVHVKQIRTTQEYASLYPEISKIDKLWKEERIKEKKLFAAALGSQTYALKTMYNYLPAEKMRTYLFYIDDILHGFEVDYVHENKKLSDAFIGRFVSKHRSTGQDLGRFGAFALMYVIRYSPERVMNLGSGTPRKGVHSFKEKFVYEKQSFIYNNISKLVRK